ncbi:MAG: GMC family oxidoreductase [bacterium]|nr:GMC family oxidoreductase [bacterium]
MTYDFVIVGGGSTGAVLAARLTENSDTSVLLLEAGPVEPDPEADRLGAVDFSHTGRDWGFQARTTGDATAPYPQGRTLGGGSSVNGGVALRGMPSDYDAWASPNWSWEAMAPCFRRLEDDPLGANLLGPSLHGTGGPIPIRRAAKDDLVAPQQQLLAAAQDNGLAWVDDHNDGVSEGIGPSPQNVVDEVRVSTAMAYLRPVDGRPNLTVVGGAHAHHIVIERDRATAVAYSSDGGSSLEQVRGRHILVCAGALNTPALLMRSGIGPLRDLEAVGIRPIVDLPGVGANLMEHVGAFIFVVPPEGTVTTDMVQHQLLIRYSSPDSPLVNDMQIGMMNHWDLSQNPALAEVCGSELIWGICAGIQTPHSRGRLRVLSSDPDHPPVIDLNLLDIPEDTAHLIAGLRLCYRLATHEALAERFERVAVLDGGVFSDGDYSDLAEYTRQFSFPWYHASGTCRMGPDPDAGDVVDGYGRVHGVERLSVFDASILPMIPRANTNLTCIAVGERAAELLR